MSLLNNNRARVFLAVLMACFLALTSEAAPKKPARKAATKGRAAAADTGAAMAFPAAGLFDPEKGSVEMVFSPSYSAEENLGVGSGMRTFTVFSLYGPKASGRGEDGLSWHVGIGQWQNKNYLIISSSRFERPVPYKPSEDYITSGMRTADEKEFKGGEWYAFAATWERAGTNYTLNLYFDGKRQTTYKMPISRLFGESKVHPKDLLVIGNPRVMRGSLESLRISNRARTYEEIAANSKAPLAKDADTLLFIDAEMALGMRTRPADVLINKDAKNLTMPTGGLLFGRVTEVPGRSGGKAIEFPR